MVGKALNHQTPVFAKEMKYIIFRPYWNLPLDIVRAEIVPKLQRNPRYLAQKGFEATDQNGHIVAAGAVSQAMRGRDKVWEASRTAKARTTKRARLGQIHVSQ